MRNIRPEETKSNERTSQQIDRAEQNSADHSVIEAMLKISRSANGTVVFILSGRIEREDVAELERLFTLEATGRRLILDLRDVTLVDPDAVKFLARCEADGIKLENCPTYLREWIAQERSRNTGQESDYSN